MKRHEVLTLLAIAIVVLAAAAFAPAPPVMLDDSRDALASCYEALTAGYPKDEAATVRYQQRAKACIKRTFGVLEQHDRRLRQIEQIAGGK